MQVEARTVELNPPCSWDIFTCIFARFSPLHLQYIKGSQWIPVTYLVGSPCTKSNETSVFFISRIVNICVAPVKSVSIQSVPDMRRSIVGNGEDLRDRHAEHPPFIQRTEKEKKNE